MQHDHINALAPGARLRDYRIERVLGAGSFGITYKASEDVTDRPVAIKEYLPTSLATRDRDGTTVRPVSESARDDFQWGLDRFRSEARLLVQLRHPNIVHVLSYFEAHGTGYLVMVFQHGQSLGEIVAHGGTLPEAELRAMMAPLLDGVEAVHALGFLHRDIKPDNVYVRDDGTPVLLDFGAARQALGQHSRSLTAVLTEGYAPYEQYERDGEQGPWSDVYALGALMFRCLLGKTPPAAPQRVASRMRDRPDPVGPDLARLARTCTPAMAAAVTAALAVAEKVRPQSIAALRALLKDSAPAPTPQPGETLAPVVATPRSQAPSAAPTSSDATLGAGAGERTRRKRRLLPIAAGLAALALAGGAAAYFGLSSGSSDRAERRGLGIETPPRPPDRAAQEKKDAEDRRKAEEVRKADEEARQKAEDEARRKAEDDIRRRTEEDRRRAEDERRKADEETQRRAAEDQRKSAEDAQRRAEDARRKADEETRRKQEATEKAEGYVAEARRLLDDARTAIRELRFSDAKRAIEQARSKLDEAEKIDYWTVGLFTERRAAHDLELSMAARTEERIRSLVAQARQHIRAQRFDDAQKAINEASALDEASPEVSAVTRELGEARRRKADADRKRPRANIAADTRLLYDTVMRRVAELTLRTASTPGRVGQPVRYRESRQHKALAICFDWTTATPAEIQWYSFGVGEGHADLAQAQQSALDGCRQNATRACTCQIIDLNDRNVLAMPPSYLSRFYD